MPDLRTHLQVSIAGTQRPPAGNILRDTDHKAAEPFAKACARLCSASRRESGEAVSAPSALLPLLV